MNLMAGFLGCWVLGAGNQGLAPSPQFPAPSPCLAEIDHEGRAAVEPARFLTAVVVLRPFLTVADRPHPVGRNAAADEVVLHRIRTAIAEREVVLGRADVAGVPFDLDAKGGV